VNLLQLREIDRRSRGTEKEEERLTTHVGDKVKRTKSQGLRETKEGSSSLRGSLTKKRRVLPGEKKEKPFLKKRLAAGGRENESEKAKKEVISRGGEKDRYYAREGRIRQRE